MDKKKKPEENKKDLLNPGSSENTAGTNQNLPYSGDKEEAYGNLHKFPRTEGNI